MYTTSISEVMTKNVLTAHLDYSFSKISRLFFEIGIHHLPVVDDSDKLIGMLSSTDVLHAFSTQFSTLPDTSEETVDKYFTVEKMMTAQPITLRPQDDLAEAIRFFSQHSFHALPIVDNDELVGILTSNDVLDFIAERNGILESYA